jgi:hypothetical protein
MFGIVKGGGAVQYLIGAGMSFFALIGLVGVLHRYELTIDLSARSYRGVRGFWPAPRRIAGSIDDMRGVLLQRYWTTREVSDGSERREARWTVSFDFGDNDAVSFFSTPFEKQAYSTLEHYSRLLRLPAIDRTTDEERRRNPETLNRSVAQAAWSDEQSAAAPATPPVDGRIDWDPSPGAGRITLPPVGLSGNSISLVLGLCATCAGVALGLSQLGLLEIPLKIASGGWIVTAFLLLYGPGTVTLLLGLACNRQVIREELGDLLFYRTTLLGGRRNKRRLAKPDIEEIVVAKVADHYTRRLRVRRRLDLEQVVLRTDDEIVRIGETLNGEEQRWLVQALKHLAAR